MSYFDDAFEFVIGIEGGYSNDPNDSGGPTKYGIILQDLRAWRKDYNLNAEDIKNLSIEEAKDIYLHQYWNVWRLGELTSKNIAIALFDQCVNWGVGQKTLKRVQVTLNYIQRPLVDVDGVIGPQTIGALNSANERQFIFAFTKLAVENYFDLVKRKPSQQVFLFGWVRRCLRIFELLVEGT